MKRFIILISCVISAIGMLAQDNAFVKVHDGQFVRHGEPYYYIGTNFWYGPILASDTEAGNRERLSKELDKLRDLGITNLRVLAGADTGSKNCNSVVPVLQKKPGDLDEKMLEGLDYFLAELGKRDMTAVIYLNNSWEWSGGYGFYLKYAGYGDAPTQRNGGYKAYVDYASQFVKSDKAKQIFYNYIEELVGRTNSVTGKAYRDDPAIMAWQIGNEPRSFSEDGKPLLAEFLHRSAELIRGADPNHLVSVGSEGSVGCEDDLELYEQIHLSSDFDYLTIHIWPENWRWCYKASLWDDLANVYQKTARYIEDHDRIASKLDKPMVIEEFGFPRDMGSYDPASSTECRDAFYSYILKRVTDSAAKGGRLAGCNFWGWGGTGRPSHNNWEQGDDYLCDPPHEPQGWYSVFDTDTTTVQLLKAAVARLKK